MNIGTNTVEAADNPAARVAGQILGEGAGGLHLATVYLGIRLGLFRALAEAPGLRASELAESIRVHERYVLAWLQAETVAGTVQADHVEFESAHFALAPGVVEALVDEVHPDHVGGVALAMAAVWRALPEVLHAYRSGAGVPASAYGPDAVAARAARARPAFVNDLVARWLPEVPDVLARFREADRPAWVADVGSGAGWAGIELAKAFPHIRVDGFDCDESAVEAARSNARAHGVASRVRFRMWPGRVPGAERRYDAVFFMGSLWELPRPVEALAAARNAVTAEGAVMVMDERVGDLLVVGDPTQLFLAALGAVWYVPRRGADLSGVAQPGAHMRPGTLDALARRAGWAGYQVLPIEHPSLRFYRLVPTSSQEPLQTKGRHHAEDIQRLRHEGDGFRRRRGPLG